MAMETSTANPSIVEVPNVFSLSGEGISVTYTTTSIDGRPTLTWHDRTTQRSFRGESIVAEPTKIGSLVTVILGESREQGSSTFSVLIPLVNLVGSHHVSTVGITTVNRSAGGPLGQVSTYQVVHLYGTADQVQF